MKKMFKSTSAKPLMLNFTSPKPMEVVKEEDCAISYDPINQITYFMGGGSSKKSKSQITKKQTVTSWIGGKPDKTKEDYEYGSDD